MARSFCEREEISMEESEEEVRLEVEAVLAVYGDDCRIIAKFPPQLLVRITPRTADDSSQQFVEIILGITCDEQYPKKPPDVQVVDSKGLDENRQVRLVTSIGKKAEQLSSCLMLVALCEKAVELLADMNHPEGDCPLCLYPLLIDDRSGTSLPFMKLMSCYHCFHSECIIRWCKWIQEENKKNEINLGNPIVSASFRNQRDLQVSGNQNQQNCPVCRKAFEAKDIEHCLDSLGTSTPQLITAEAELGDDERRILNSESENYRRQKFEAQLKVQQENSGLIEPKKEIVIQPGMYLPETAAPLTATATDYIVEEHQDSANNTTAQINSNISSNKATTSKPRNSNGGRKHRTYNSRRQQNVHPCKKQWIKKETDISER